MAEQGNVDFKRLFEQAPGLFLVLEADAEFKVLGASEAYLKATLTRREDLLGKRLFDVFPDNPDDPAATGTSNLKASLLRVLASGKPDTMAVQKYDIRRPESEGGTFEVRYWSPLNAPVLNPNGAVACIIHRVEDVTEFVRQGHLLSEKSEALQGEILLRSQELQQSNEELRVANQRLTKLDAAKSDVIHELSVPVLKLRPQLLILPLVGMVDEARAKLIMEELLASIRKYRAKVVLLDITGVSRMDVVTANSLLRSVEASRLMGAILLVTGVSTQVAETLVHLGQELPGLRAFSSLEAGFMEADVLMGRLAASAA